MEALKGYGWSIVLGLLAVYFLVNRGDYTFLDAFELVVHEAGHVFFAPFGQFIRFAGGTLMQLIVPLIFLYGFYRGEYRPGIQVSLFLLGHSLLNVSVYAQDARAMALPLLGGKHVTHDWNWMLGQLGLLAWDQEIGLMFVAIAVVVFVFMVALPRLMLVST